MMTNEELLENFGEKIINFFIQEELWFKELKRTAVSGISVKTGDPIFLKDQIAKIRCTSLITKIPGYALLDEEVFDHIRKELPTQFPSFLKIGAPHDKAKKTLFTFQAVNQALYPDQLNGLTRFVEAENTILNLSLYFGNTSASTFLKTKFLWAYN